MTMYGRQGNPLEQRQGATPALPKLDAGMLDNNQQQEQPEATGYSPGIGDEEIAKAIITLRKYRAGKASIDRRIISCQEWWKLNNWNEQRRGDTTKNGRRGITGANEQTRSSTAWLWNCIVGKHADAIDSFPEPVILPKAQDDKEEAQRLSSVIPVILETNDFERVFSDCTWQKLQEGTGCYAVMWDADKLNGLGDVSIKKVNVLNLMWEPGITDIQESRNVFLLALVDTDILEQQYPDLKDRLKDRGEVVKSYRYDDDIDLTDKSVVVDWYYKKWQNGRQVLHYCKFVGETILYATENDEQRREEGLYRDGLYPFVMDPLFPVEGQPTGYGLIDIGKDTQADIDTLSQAIIENAAASATVRYFTRKDAGVNEREFLDYSKKLVHTNGNLGEDAVRQIIVSPIGGNVMSVLQQKIDELKFVTGNTDINNGGVPSGVTAASAIAALKEDAGRTSMDSTKAAYRAFRRIVGMVIERIRQFYDLPRQFRITGTNGEMDFVRYSNEQLQPQGMGMLPGAQEESYRLPAFDIEVRAQRENAYTKMSQNELALQFYGNGFFNPQMTDQALMAIDMMEFKGKDELAQKIAQQGTLAEMMTKFQQIALALAQKYEPDTAEQLAQMIMGQAQGGPAPAPMANPSQALTGGGDETANAEKEAAEGSRNKAMRQRVAEATRVN